LFFDGKISAGSVFAGYIDRYIIGSVHFDDSGYGGSGDRGVLTESGRIVRVFVALCSDHWLTVMG
jgi:hypothetical protein